jgi:hypothetical protein
MRLAQLIAEADLASRDHPHPGIEKDIGRIIDLLQGPEQLGGGRSGGLVADVAEIKTRLNGGLVINLPVWIKFAGLALTAAQIWMALKLVGV